MSHALHMKTTHRYSFFVNAPFIWNALPGSILCVQVIIDQSFLLTMFLVFLSFVSLCKRGALL